MNGYTYLAIYDSLCLICGTVIILHNHLWTGIVIALLSQMTVFRKSAAQEKKEL